MRPEFYKERRQAFAEKMKNGSFAVLTSGELVPSTADANYVYEVDRNFYYLTGVDFPGVLLSIEKDKNGNVKETMFAPFKDPDKEKWTGFIPSAEELSAKSGAAVSDIVLLDQFDDYLEKMGEGNFTDVYAFYQDVPDNVPEIPASYIYYRLCDEYLDIEVLDIMDILMPMRAVKTEEEVDAIVESAHITKKALDAVLSELKPGLMEYEMIALFNYTVARNRARLAFNTIAASGEYATILHYIEGENEIKDGSMLLIDCGAAKNWYNSDVTRTYPANGKFDERQKLVYSIVLEGNKMVAEAVKPGVTLIELNDMLKEYFARELKKIGLIENDEELVKYYYHSVSHSLGLDTHDVFTKTMPLEPGMVITDEPGLYIREWGIGVRIEDDVLVTEDGHRVLTDFIPKEIDEIEALMAK